MLFGLVEENGADSRNVTATLGVNNSFTIPLGLLHFAQNNGCEEAQYLANYNHRDPGTLTTHSSFLRIPNSVVRGSLNVDDAMIEALRAAAAAVKNPGVDPVCAKKCGLPGH
jgi:hypothetical protein